MSINHEPQALQQKATRPTLAATGYLAENFGHFEHKDAAVIVNPNASASSVAAWCWGEVMSMLASADAMTLSTEPVSTGDIAAVFIHRLRPMDRILCQLVEDIRAFEERGSGQGQ